MDLNRLLSIMFVLLSFSLRGQDIQSFVKQTNEYHDSKLVEKIHLHLDKYSYTAGETIWFKAYTVIGIENFLSNLSNIAYVELINPKSACTKQITIPLISGIGMGDITLPDTLIEGTYRLRAYTRWMQNDSTQFFFEQNIYLSNGRMDNILTESALSNDQYTIHLKDMQDTPLPKTTIRYEIMGEKKTLKKGRVTTDETGSIDIPFSEEYANAQLTLSFEKDDDTPVTKIFKLPNKSKPNTLQIFPEGGALLSGTLNNIAVKALKPDGKGVKAKVVIINTAKDSLTSFETNALGMGTSMLFIGQVEKLVAHVSYADGSKDTVALPLIQESGYNILINNKNTEKLYAQVNLSESFINQQDLYLVVHYLGKTFYVARQKATQGELLFSVDKKNLPNGILTLSILNSSLLPVIERPVFIFNGKNNLPLDVTTNNTTFSARKKVDVSINSGTPSDTLRNAALSASVINISKIEDSIQTAPNILTHLLLSADIKGYIENPGYYFSPEIKFQDIDALLLTQGWRKIDFNSGLTSTPPTFEPEKGISIDGQARKLGRKAGSPHAKLKLISTHNFMAFVDTVADEEGYFQFDQLFFPDSIKFLITAEDQKGKKNIDILISPSARPLIGTNRNAPAERNNINSLFHDQLQQNKRFFAGLEAQGLMQKMIALEEIAVTARAPRKKASENSSNLNGPGNADQILTAEDLETCPSLDMCLNGRLLGVLFRNGVPYTTRGGGEMQVVLDGMYIEADQISMINPQDIQSVEVLRNINYTSIYGSNGANGVIIITSKTGRDAMNNYIPKGIITLQPKGLHVNKTFYKPTYEVDSENRLTQDLRTTIHWEPNIITDKEGNASFDFYTADENGKYLIILEGLDFTGKVGRKTVEIEVKN